MIAAFWPSCHPGGLVVDYVRNCYRGWWRLWEGGPLIQGRYVWAPPGTPSVPWPHFFTARHLTMKGERGPDWLGENSEAEERWEGGGLNFPAPPPRLIGTAQDFARPRPGPAPPQGTSYGFDRRLWIEAGLPPPPPD